MLAVVQSSRLVQHTPVARAREAARSARAFGLGVLHYLGSIIEIEAVAFPAREPRKGTVRFNDTAGSMAKDSRLQRSSRRARADRTSIRAISIFTSTWSAAATSTDRPRVSRSSSRSTRRVTKTAAAAGRRGDRRALDHREGPGRRRRSSRSSTRRARRGCARSCVPAENAREIDPSLAGIESSRSRTVERGARSADGPSSASAIASACASAARGRADERRRSSRDVDRIPPQQSRGGDGAAGFDPGRPRDHGERSARSCSRPTSTRHFHETIYLALLALYERGRTARQDHARRGARVARHARQGRRSRVPHLADGYGADRRVGRVLREDRAREGRVAQADPRRDADHAARLRSGRRRRRRRSTHAEQLVYDVGQRHVPRRSSSVANRCCSTRSSRSSGGTTPRGDRTGFTSGFRDIDEYTTGLPAGQSGHHRRTSGHGQNLAGAEHGGRPPRR